MAEIEQRQLGKVLTQLLRFLAIGTSLFYLYTGWTGGIGMLRQRAPILIVAMVLIFLTQPLSKKFPRQSFIIDSLLAVLSLGLLAFLWSYDLIQFEKHIAGPSPLDLVLGGILMVMILEATRRSVGWPLTAVTIASILYARFGGYFPGLLYHGGFSWSEIIDYVSISGEGLFGLPMYVVATVIVLFIIFGSFLQVSGGSWFFIEFPRALFGGVRGGPAKIAVVASGLVGTVSGSVVANVVTTGTFTIPMMKRLGYSPTMAGAIETAASTGGQIMPPIMGVAAFIMADFLEISYWSVVMAAILPATLYYIGLFVAVDMEAAKMGMKGLPRSELPSLQKTLARGWFLSIPLIVLVYFLGVVKVTPPIAAIYAIIATVVVSMFSKTTRMSIRKILLALEEGAKAMPMVAVACAAAGIVIATLSMTGLGIAISSLIVEIAGGSVLRLLLLAAVSSTILGFALTTTPTYILLAILIAPALSKMGLPLLASHLFLFYYGCLSQLTPPSAIGAYAAAGIAGASPMKTAFTAMRIGIIAYVIPFFFIYNQELLLQGAPGAVASAAVTATVGVVAFALMIAGHMILKTGIVERILLGVAGLLLMWPGVVTDAPGFGLLGLVVMLQLIKRRAQYRRAGNPLS